MYLDCPLLATSSGFEKLDPPSFAWDRDFYKVDCAWRSPVLHLPKGGQTTRGRRAAADSAGHMFSSNRCSNRRKAPWHSPKEHHQVRLGVPERVVPSRAFSGLRVGQPACRLLMESKPQDEGRINVKNLKLVLEQIAAGAGKPSPGLEPFAKSSPTMRRIGCALS